ncbi:hypothetical protein [Breoghania sp. L-A4]|uniref:hypothetical protein n=1 Tax=Breoghania sp. L-A4 TaxID=2304600 RepID=UPI000E3608B2|nr:hypothetical protein [Breoghania sp. L-A4]AXS41906.1 hypothetical protein D1F64_20220 [Breoghania sp. L-A4]
MRLGLRRADDGAASNVPVSSSKNTTVRFPLTVIRSVARDAPFACRVMRLSPEKARFRRAGSPAPCGQDNPRRGALQALPRREADAAPGFPAAFHDAKAPQLSNRV